MLKKRLQFFIFLFLKYKICASYLQWPQFDCLFIDNITLTLRRLQSLMLWVIHLTSVCFLCSSLSLRWALCVFHSVFYSFNFYSILLHLIFVKVFTNWKTFWWMHDSLIPTIKLLLFPFRVSSLPLSLCLFRSLIFHFWRSALNILTVETILKNKQTNKRIVSCVAFTITALMLFLFCLFVCLLVFRILHWIEVNSQQPIHLNGINIVIELFVRSCKTHF